MSRGTTGYPKYFHRSARLNLISYSSALHVNITRAAVMTVTCPVTNFQQSAASASNVTQDCKRKTAFFLHQAQKQDASVCSAGISTCRIFLPSLRRLCLYGTADTSFLDSVFVSSISYLSGLIFDSVDAGVHVCACLLVSYSSRHVDNLYLVPRVCPSTCLFSSQVDVFRSAI